MQFPTIPRPWQGLRFHLPQPPQYPSSFTLSLGVRDRGGTLVGPGENADVIVLPDSRSDLPRRNTHVARLLDTGAVVMWERAFLRALRAR